MTRVDKAPAVCDNEPRIAPVTHPEITAVPPFVMLPEPGTLPPSLARTSIPEMVSASIIVFPLIVSWIVINDEVIDVTTAELMSFPGNSEALTAASALKLQPVGLDRLIVTLVPIEKSPTMFSVITTSPRVVKAGDVAFADLSAEMLDPPDAFVMVTEAMTSE